MATFNRQPKTQPKHAYVSESFREEFWLGTWHDPYVRGFMAGMLLVFVAVVIVYVTQ